jgi:hypothetical protein
MRKVMIRSCISFDPITQEQKPREKQAAEKQKGNFAGAAKKKVRTDKVAQRSLVHVPDKTEVSDSDCEATPEYGSVAMMMQSSPRPTSMDAPEP